MQFLKTVVGVAVVVGGFALVSATAYAQTPPGGPEQRPLSVTAATFAGYDTDITSRGARPSTTGADINRGASNVGASLAMSYGGGTEDLSYYTTGTTEYRVYRADQSISAPLASGAAGLSAALGRRLRFTGSLASTYFPRFQFSVLPPTTDVPLDQPPPTLDYGISTFDVVSYQGTAGLGYQLSARSSLRLTYGRSQFRYIGRDYQLSTHSVGGGYSRSLTRYASLQLGYTELGGEYVNQLGQKQPTVRRRTMDAGINYSRPLSISRRTTLGFTTGSTALDNGNHTFYTLTGNAHLNHQLGRAWNLGAAYSRRVGLIGGFDEPIFADATSLSISGLVGRLVSVTASAGYSNGKVGLASLDRNYNSLQSNAGASLPITRRLSWYGNYFFYRYMFDESVTLPVGLTPHVSRHGVRTGLSYRIY